MSHERVAELFVTERNFSGFPAEYHCFLNTTVPNISG
jgi:hypothetical protein